jgi:hypothetical protein
METDKMDTCVGKNSTAGALMVDGFSALIFISLRNCGIMYK